MTADAVRTVFSSKWSPSDDSLNIGKHSYVSVDFFANLFKDVSDSPTYDELVTIDSENNYGYRDFFDKCREEGILN